MSLVAFLRVFIFTFFCISLIFPGAISHAQSFPLVTSVDVTYEFGSVLTISAQLESTFQSDEFYIILQPDHQNSRQIKLIPTADNSLLLIYDLDHDPLKPFSRIYYWYQFNSSDGSTSNSPSFWFDYIDNRYQWKNLNSRLFDIYWTDGDSAFGQNIQDIAKNGLEKATQILPVAPQLPIRIYVYPNSTALQESLFFTHQGWLSGHASPELGVVLVSNAVDQSNMIELERQIPHELMHILQYQVTGNDYSLAPAWILEGLATYAETYPNPDLDRIITKAHNDNLLHPLETLCQVFPINAEDASIAYAQSLSIVKYIENRFGSQSFLKILEQSKTGLDCEQIITSVIGLSSSQLTFEWQTKTFPGLEANSIKMKDWTLYALAAAIIFITAFLIIREIRRKRKENINE